MLSARQRPAADRRPHHQLAARLRVRAGQVVAHRLQLRDPVDVAQHECAQAAVGGRAASRQVRGLRLSRWLRRQAGWRDRRAHPAGRERSAAQLSSMGPARAAPSPPGHKFTLTTHPDEDVVSEQGKSYLLTSVEHCGQPAERRHRRHGRRQLQQSVHVHRRFGAVSPGADDAAAGDLGRADGGRRRPGRRRDLYGQVRPGEGAVPLGSGGQEGREQLLLDSRVADVGGQGLGLGVDAAHRARGDRRVPRRRSRPADHHRQRAQRGQQAAAHRCRQRAQVEHAQGHGLQRR